MSSFDSAKNIAGQIIDISTEHLVCIQRLIERELKLRHIEDTEGIDEKYVDKFGQPYINFELLFRKEKKQKRDLQDRLEADKKRVIQEQHEEYENIIARNKQTELAKDAQDQMIVLDTENTSDFFVNKPDFRKQKKVKPIYKSYRLKSQKRLDKEKRAKRKPANLFA
jgi:hypothetical protein